MSVCQSASKFSQRPDRLTVNLHVGNESDFRKHGGRVRIATVRVLVGGSKMENPEMPTEGNELLVVNVLATNQQYQMIVPRPLDGLHLLRIELAAQVHTANFGTYFGTRRNYFERHLSTAISISKVLAR